MKNTNKPGMLLFFDDWEALLSLDDRSLASLFRAALHYSKYGVIPEFSGTMAVFWKMIEPKLDRDGERYDKSVLQRRYAAFARYEKEAGREPVPFEEWCTVQREEKQMLPDAAGCGRIPSDTEEARPDAEKCHNNTSPLSSSPLSSSQNIPHEETGVAGGETDPAADPDLAFEKDRDKCLQLLAEHQMKNNKGAL